jgi:hypothetical protein
VYTGFWIPKENGGYELEPSKGKVLVGTEEAMKIDAEQCNTFGGVKFVYNSCSSNEELEIIPGSYIRCPGWVEISKALLNADGYWAEKCIPLDTFRLLHG